MFNYIRSKIQHHKQKSVFKEYGHRIDKFNLTGYGEVEFAQWLHPFEQTKKVDNSIVNFYKKYVNEGDFLIDIGAHGGDTTVPMALAAGATGTVLALEPNPYVYKILDVNAKLNKNKTNIVPAQFAATDKEGTFQFNYSDASFCNGGFLSKISNQKHHHNYTLDVQGKNLDKYLRENYSNLLPKLSLIKVDAEGYDKEILKSISSILLEFKPAILLECYKKLTTEERGDLFDTLVSRGYTLYYNDGFDENNTMIKLRKEDMDNWKHYEMVALVEE